MLRGLLRKGTRQGKQTSQLRIGRLLEFWKTALTLSVCQGNRRAASQPVKHRRRRSDLAAGPICGTASPRCARALPSADTHATTIPLKRRPPRDRCRRSSAGFGRQAARRSGAFPGRSPSARQSGDQVWRCSPAGLSRCRSDSTGSRTGNDLPACDRRRVKVQRAVTKSLPRHTRHRAGRGVALDATMLVPRRRPSFMPSSTPARTQTLGVACRAPSRTPGSTKHRPHLPARCALD